ncbi:NAD(P)-dependent oxidoreductase [Achromobacter sp. DH1f]|uniref:NAD-dependent epimerase/dehydratase family protein n=1 Tax=Achromobacter sp. DH1f TaxID=1397275 RepID=UPI00068C4603|nr:NAD(P)-dependent oxidoreductase [Achromobacter sp. DH1f]
MMRYVIGARGRLGHAIVREYAGQDVQSLDRAVYQAWSRPGMAGDVARYFEGLAGAQGATIYVASGLLDPALPQEELLGVNYHLPRNVIDGAAAIGARVITFGTVMESLLRSKNPYIQSKTALAAYVAEAVGAGAPAAHLQIHTLFGAGVPSPFMFLGQMLAALREDRPFKMTSGRQLREYHHLDDEACAVRKIAESSVTGVLNVSHGRPVSLRAVAESVFGAFGRDDLLCVGALTEPPEENYQKILPPTELLDPDAFRETLPAIAKYMQDCYSGQETQA